MQRQHFFQVSIQRAGEGLTQDGWLDIAAGEIECTAAFKEWPIRIAYYDGTSWLTYSHASGCEW